ncbi:Hypothetical protein GLP15_3088 [Giardia lamblia P15]|uniref:Uncharacterized protein n=1 Tax=Giardia intestinalis (strain P15) TaxID=658858 RepID=E1F2U3_GIAIA|nr:Hypothetical protein GLP15_3088 [Giardia lamblia P15]
MLALIEDQAQGLYIEGIRLNDEIRQLDERIGEMQELIDTFTIRLSQLRKKTEGDVVRRDKDNETIFLRLKLTGVAHSTVLFINCCSLVAIVCILLLQVLQSSIMQ